MRKRILVIAALTPLAFLVTACGDDDDSGSASTPSSSSAPTPEPSESSSSAPPTGGPACEEQDLLDQLPEGSTMDKFQCANVDGVEWAAVKVNPGPTVFFLKWSGSSWAPMTSDEVCGTASAGLPEDLLAFCS